MTQAQSQTGKTQTEILLKYTPISPPHFECWEHESVLSKVECTSADHLAALLASVIAGLRREEAGGRQLFYRSGILTCLKARCSVRQKEEKLTIYIPVAVPILYDLNTLELDFGVRGSRGPGAHSVNHVSSTATPRLVRC